MHVYDDRQGSHRVSGPVFSVSVAAKLFVSAAGARAHHAGSRFDLSVPQPPGQLLNGLKKKRKKKGILMVTFSMLQNTLCGNYSGGKNTCRSSCKVRAVDYINGDYGPRSRLY